MIFPPNPHCKLQPTVTSCWHSLRTSSTEVNFHHHYLDKYTFEKSWYDAAAGFFSPILISLSKFTNAFKSQLRQDVSVLKKYFPFLFQRALQQEKIQQLNSHLGSVPLEGQFFSRMNIYDSNFMLKTLPKSLRRGRCGNTKFLMQCLWLMRVNIQQWFIRPLVRIPLLVEVASSSPLKINL